MSTEYASYPLNKYYIVLYCTVLYCTVLYCTVLFCTVPNYAVLKCALLYRCAEARSKGEKEREKDDRTAHLYGEIANTVMPKSIVMEVDFPSAHSSRRIPILDMEVWVRKEQESSGQEQGSKEKEQGSKAQEIYCISFNFYAKPMASRDVFTSRVPSQDEKRRILLFRRRVGD